MNDTELNDLITSDESAELAGIKRDTWSSYVARDQAPQPARHIGTKPLWDRDEVQAWVASRPRAGKD